MKRNFLFLIRIILPCWILLSISQDLFSQVKTTYKGKLTASKTLKEGLNFIGEKEGNSIYIKVYKRKIVGFEIQDKTGKKNLATFDLINIAKSKDSPALTISCTAKAYVCISWGCVEVEFQIDCKSMPDIGDIDL